MEKTKKNLSTKYIFVFLGFILSNNINSQVVNHCFDFEGNQSSYITAGYVEDLENISTFTIEFWLYIDSWKEGAIIYTNEGNEKQKKISLALGDNTSKEMCLHISDGANSFMTVNNLNISINKWHHLSVVYKGNENAFNQLNLYIDGNRSLNKSFSDSNGLLPSSTPIAIGNFLIGKNFDGKIDEFRIWNLSITPQESGMFNTINQNHLFYQSLILYYKGDYTKNKYIIDDKGKYFGKIYGNVNKIKVINNEKFTYKVISGYVREGIYQRGIIEDKYLQNCNDLIMLQSIYPTANGDLFYKYPDNDGKLINVDFVDQFAGRNGVLNFKGNESLLNCGKGLLLKNPDQGTNVFTFEAWVYIDEWIENSFLFIKTGDDRFQKVDIQFGPKDSKTVWFHINNGSNTYAYIKNAIEIDQWQHIALAYDGKKKLGDQVSITINGLSVKPLYNQSDKSIASSCTSKNADFIIGKNFKGKIDDIRLWDIFRTPSLIENWKNKEIDKNSWEYSQMKAYWKIENKQNPSLDFKNIKYDFSSLKSTFKNQDGVSIRLGIASGNWKEMIKTEKSRQNFAENLKNICNQLQADGVDLDFEWCTTNEEWKNYSLLISTINNSLGSDKIFSVSLHSFFYKLTLEAINALDLISLQVYGPQQSLFDYKKFISDYNTVTSYGIPSNKLIMGVPFYGQSSNGVEVSYKQIVSANPNIDSQIDQVNMMVDKKESNVVFNGLNTINSKANFVNENCAGIMFWDTSTDVAYEQPQCLLKQINSVINANINEKVDDKNIHVEELSTDVLTPELKNVLIYPNPARDFIYISVADNCKKVIIYDINGTKLKVKKNKEFDKTQTVSVSDLQAGLYFISVENFNGEFYKSKFLIN